MADQSPRFSRNLTPLVHDDAMYDYRTRLRMQQAETAARRQRDLVDQASDLNTPAARIRIWERLHHARLPEDPGHPLLAVIAAGTRLTLTQVGDEQRIRFVRSRAAPALSGANPV